jgi:hypothetical protein
MSPANIPEVLIRKAEIENIFNIQMLKDTGYAGIGWFESQALSGTLRGLTRGGTTKLGICAFYLRIFRYYLVYYHHKESKG